MYLRLTPIKLTLYALVTLEVDLGFTSFKKVLFKTKLWRYKAPTIMKLLIDNTKKEEDESPPEVKSFGVRNICNILIILWLSKFLSIWLYFSPQLGLVNQ